MVEGFICGLCGKLVDSVYFWKDKEICEKCYRSEKQKEADQNKSVVVEQREGEDNDESNNAK